MDSYEKLRELLDAHPSGAPPSKAFDAILRILFSPEEAAMASHMTLTLRPLEAIAAVAGVSVETAGSMLEAMADRAIIFSREKDGGMKTASYELKPVTADLPDDPQDGRSFTALRHPADVQPAPAPVRSRHRGAGTRGRRRIPSTGAGKALPDLHEHLYDKNGGIRAARLPRPDPADAEGQGRPARKRDKAGRTP